VELAGKELISNELASKLSKELAPLLVKRGRRQSRKNLNIIIFF